MKDRNGVPITAGCKVTINFGIPPTTATLDIVDRPGGLFMQGEICSDYLKEEYLDSLEVIV